MNQTISHRTITEVIQGLMELLEVAQMIFPVLFQFRKWENRKESDDPVNVRGNGSRKEEKPKAERDEGEREWSSRLLAVIYLTITIISISVNF